MITRALLSVSDKTGLAELAKFLRSRNVEILSTGGTAKFLREQNIPVREVSDFTGFPEVFGGRVKTLHPKIHGGLLFQRENAEHVAMAQKEEILPIDLVVVNLYPFQQTITKAGVQEVEVIENIDIGGPSMLRSAAKNFVSVTVVTDPIDYATVQMEIEKHGDTTLKTRRAFAAKVFVHTTRYDAYIAHYFDPNFFTLTGHKIQALRYGENPHQKADFYELPTSTPPAIALAEQLQGKELSFNNILDANAALEIICEFATDPPAATIIKHLNPCGTAVGATLSEAFTKAYETDSQSAFGGIVALNQAVDTEVAKQLSALFLEIIVAPSFTTAAQEILSAKKNLRLLAVGKITPLAPALDIRTVSGGFLVQDLDTKELSITDLRTVTSFAPTATQMADLLFAWKVCRHVKSNAIVFGKDQVSIGVGAGQMSRVESVEIALKKAGAKAQGAVCASDAFFPFPDSIDLLAQAQISAIIQPGGAQKDAEVIAAAEKAKIAMVFTGIRAFRH